MYDFDKIKVTRIEVVMPLALLAVLLPTLFWDQPAGTADALRKAGIERLYVPEGREAAWRKEGFAATAFDRTGAIKATVPKVEYRMDVASATSVPWIDANGWQFQRAPARTYFYDVPKGSAALAAAEASTYGVDSSIRAAPGDLQALGEMLRFLGAMGQTQSPPRANIGVIDDGSEAMGEVLNLLARHNLLFQVIPSPDAQYDLTIRLGAGGFTKEDIADPYDFAMKMRRRLTDEKRLVRIYGSNVVLVRLTGTRVHLLNYGQSVVRGLRVRVLGDYKQGKLAAFGHPDAALADYSVEDGATEFTIPELGVYAVVDLK